MFESEFIKCIEIQKLFDILHICYLFAYIVVIAHALCLLAQNILPTCCLQWAPKNFLNNDVIQTAFGRHLPRAYFEGALGDAIESLFPLRVAWSSLGHFP